MGNTASKNYFLFLVEMKKNVTEAVVKGSVD